MDHLGQTARLLNGLGDDQWCLWAERCRRKLEVHDAAAFDDILGVFAGMGSFNDLVIMARNGHIVEPEEEPAVNEQLGKLRTRIWEDANFLARELRPSA